MQRSVRVRFTQRIDEVHGDRQDLGDIDGAAPQPYVERSPSTNCIAM